MVTVAQFRLLCSCVLGGLLPSTQPRWTALASLQRVLLDDTPPESALSVQTGRRRERGNFALFSVFIFIPFLIILLIQWISVPHFVLVLFVLSFFLSLTSKVSFVSGGQVWDSSCPRLSTIMHSLEISWPLSFHEHCFLFSAIPFFHFCHLWHLFTFSLRIFFSPPWREKVYQSTAVTTDVWEERCRVLSLARQVKIPKC